MQGLRNRQGGATRSAQAISTAAALLTLLAVTGCRQDMHNQPKFYPQRGSTFFADGRSVRPQVENTIARGQQNEDSYFYTGFEHGQEGKGLPFPVTIDVLARGQERYNIYCTPCHSRVGNGAGMIVQRGYSRAGNFHTARLESAPLGHFFNVISNGYGAMPDYAAQVTPADRWAIVAYIKALQLSQNAQQNDVASGKHVEPLSAISDREGFTPGFALNWGMPPTAVTGTPDDQPYVLPAANNGSGNGRSGETPQTGHPERPSMGQPVQSSTGYPWVRPSPGAGGSSQE
jgi:mono/diheme cytochrome c family protein